MLAALVNGRQALVDALEGVTERMAALEPAPGRWSIRQCVEHVAIVEGFLLGRIESSTKADTPMVDPRREARIRERGADRTRPIQVPPEGVPDGRFATVAEALRHFLDTRARTIAFVENTADDLRARITSHPLVPVVSCYETLLMIAAHPERHARQIAETRAALERV